MPKRSRVDRVFLDANVLFSAAWRADSGLLRIWDRPTKRVMVTSGYAAAEARRNLPDEARRGRLETLLARTEIVAEPAKVSLPGTLSLAEKDRPILAAAIASRCTHLLTGDRMHFGVLFGAVVGGVRVERPAEYLARRR